MKDTYPIITLLLLAFYNRNCYKHVFGSEVIVAEMNDLQQLIINSRWCHKKPRTSQWHHNVIKMLAK